MPKKEPKQKLVLAQEHLSIAKGSLQSYSRRTNIEHQSFRDKAIDLIGKAQEKIKAILDTYEG